MEAREFELETLRMMSPAKKLAVMQALIRQAFELKRAAIRELEPDLSEAQVEARVRQLVGGEGP